MSWFVIMLLRLITAKVFHKAVSHREQFLNLVNLLGFNLECNWVDEMMGDLGHSGWVHLGGQSVRGGGGDAGWRCPCPIFHLGRSLLPVWSYHGHLVRVLDLLLLQFSSPAPQHFRGTYLET